MSEDRFFQQVKSVMSEYRPEVPGNVYEGVRKKMWWSNFLRFDATRLNIWYVALATGLTALVLINVNQPSTAAVDSTIAPMENRIEVSTVPAEVPASNTPINEGQPADQTISTKKIAVEKTAPVQSIGSTEEIVTVDAASVEVAEEAHQQPQQEAQQIKNESQAPAKANKRGLKVKTYSAEGDKK